MVYTPENHICTQLSINQCSKVYSKCDGNTENESLSAMILRYFVDGAPPV